MEAKTIDYTMEKYVTSIIKISVRDIINCEFIQDIKKSYDKFTQSGCTIDDDNIEIKSDYNGNWQFIIGIQDLHPNGIVYTTYMSFDMAYMLYMLFRTLPHYLDKIVDASVSEDILQVTFRGSVHSSDTMDNFLKLKDELNILKEEGVINDK